MGHYANKAKLSTEVPASYSPSLQSPSPTLLAPGASSFNFEIEWDRDGTNWFGTYAFSPFSSQVNDSTFHALFEGAHVLHSHEQVLETLRYNYRASSSTPEVVDAKRLKKQKTSTTTSNNDF